MQAGYRKNRPVDQYWRVIFNRDGKGEWLSDGNLLIRLLHKHGFCTTRADLEWFALPTGLLHLC